MKISVTREIEVENGEDVEVTFDFDVRTWNERVPYGSTYASMPCGECECSAIWVNGKDITEDELAKLIGADKERMENLWESVETEAYEDYEAGR